MAQSGSYKSGYIRIDWQVVSRDEIENYSIVQATYSFTGYINPDDEEGVALSMNLHGVSGYNQIYHGDVQNITLKATVHHHEDGTAMFKVTASHQYYVSSSKTSITKWFELDPIPRQATIVNAPNFTDEDNPTITYNNPAGESVSGLAACISLDGTEPLLEYRDIEKTGTEYTFNLTEEERRLLREATDGSNSRTVFFYVRTILGETFLFSYKEVTFTIINGVPEIEATITDTNETTLALTGDNKKLIKYFSNAKAYMNMIAYKEAYFTAYYIENNGIKVDSTYSHTFEAVENNNFVFYVADNRNNAVSQTVAAPMVDYVKLTCNYQAQKMPATGVMLVKCGGNYYNDTFGKVANTLTVQYRYKEQGGTFSSWKSMTATKSENTYAAEAEIAGLDYRKTYVFQCRAADKLMTILSSEVVIKSFPLFHWGENDFVFEVPVTFNEGIVGIGSGNWQPTLINTNDAAEIEYTVRQGWYNRVGNTVNVGWQIKAAITSPSETNNITIAGAPFYPAFAAFGGGVAHNIIISGGFCFECWAIGTDGNITARLQPSNNTENGALNISSVALYPVNSTITVAGSICYTTNDV